MSVAGLNTHLHDDVSPAEKTVYIYEDICIREAHVFMNISEFGNVRSRVAGYYLWVLCVF